MPENQENPEYPTNPEEDKLQRHLETLCTGLQTFLAETKNAASLAQPPVVQEIVLAQRHLEDARMRLGVALALQKGFDPWATKVGKVQK